MGGEQTANREPGGAWATVWREVERPDRQWQGEWQQEKVMRYRMDIICGMVTGLYGEKEEGVRGDP